MRVVVQRALQAEVRVDGVAVGSIHNGLLVLLAVEAGDTREDVLFMSRKLLSIRVFDDAEGRMNCSVSDVKGEVLLISQFTLFGDCRKGTRPSYSRAASPELAEDLYHQLADRIGREGIPVETGRFRARMEVSSVNDGPVTLIIDSKKKFY